MTLRGAGWKGGGRGGAGGGGGGGGSSWWFFMIVLRQWRYNDCVISMMIWRLCYVNDDMTIVLR